MGVADNFEILHPTKRFSIVVPRGLRTDIDGGTLSLWKEGSELVLQVSSMPTPAGQIPKTAAVRMEEHLKWFVLAKSWDDDTHPHQCRDWRTIGGVDKEDNRWVLCWGVFPSVTLLTTIISPEIEMRTASEWARESIRSIEATGVE